MEINNIQDVYFLLTNISSGVILTLSFLLVSIHLPRLSAYRKFNKARFYLAFSYAILGTAGLISNTFPCDIDYTKILLITTSVAAFQSLLFTATHIIFVQPDILNQKRVVQQVILILFWILSLSCCYLYHIIPSSILLPFILISYFVQQGYYTYKFLRIHQHCVQQMDQFYEEEQTDRLRWIKYSFFGALTIGLLSLVASLSGVWVYTLFTILYTLFYTYMVVLVYNNQLITKVIFPAVTASPSEEPQPEPPTGGTTVPDDAESEECHQIFKQNLIQWMNEKGYLQKDLSVDEIASLLHTNRDYLRFYFRTYIHSDFRTWRSELRINEAKQIMEAHPDYTFSKIAEMVGFNHRANFFNQFQKIEGMTPTEWKKQKGC